VKRRGNLFFRWCETTDGLLRLWLAMTVGRLAMTVGMARNDSGAARNDRGVGLAMTVGMACNDGGDGLQ